MKSWQFAVVGWALLTTAGCRTDPAIPILERQLRLQSPDVVIADYNHVFDPRSYLRPLWDERWSREAAAR